MAKAKRLTDAMIERVGPRNDGPKARPVWVREEYPDTLAPGLRLVVQPSGKKSWAVRYRLAGKSEKFTIGPYPSFSLVEARAATAEAAKAVARRRRPLAVKRVREAATVEALVERWLATDQKANRGRDGVKRLFDREVIPRLGSVPVSEVTRDDAEAIVAGIAKRGAETHARRAHAHLRRFFQWLLETGRVEANPLVAVAKPGRENPRDRFLSEDELRRVWRAAEGLAYPVGPAYRLLVLTGCRLSEIAELRWAEVNLGAARIELEGARTKNGKPFLIPLAPAAVELLAGLPRVGRNPVWVFTTGGDAPVSLGTKPKRALDAAAAKLAPDGSALPEPAPLKPWRVHDLRRTLATHAAERELADPHVIEAALNHLSGYKGGVAGVYNRAAYLDQKAALARRWADFVTERAAPDNVVALRA